MNYDRDRINRFRIYCGIAFIVVFLGASAGSDGEEKGKECARMGVADMDLIADMDCHPVADRR